MSQSKRPQLLDILFRNKNGRRVYWQAPNLPLTLALLSYVIAILALFGEESNAPFVTLGTGWLLAWAYLELTQGETLFRRILGAGATVVAIIVLVGLGR